MTYILWECTVESSGFVSGRIGDCVDIIVINEILNYISLNLFNFNENDMYIHIQKLMHEWNKLLVSSSVTNMPVFPARRQSADLWLHSTQDQLCRLRSLYLCIAEISDPVMELRLVLPGIRNYQTYMPFSFISFIGAPWREDPPSLTCCSKITGRLKLKASRLIIG